MPVDTSSLSIHLRQPFFGESTYPADETEAAAALAAIYRLYASSGTAVPTLPVAVSLAAAEQALSKELAEASLATKSAGARGVEALVLAIDKAVVNFWLRPVAFRIPPGSITGVLSIAPPAVLAVPLARLFHSGGRDGLSAKQQASSFATILDSWTRTVLVTNTPPGPPPVPLT